MKRLFALLLILPVIICFLSLGCEKSDETNVADTSSQKSQQPAGIQSADKDKIFLPD